MMHALHGKALGLSFDNPSPRIRIIYTSPSRPKGIRQIRIYSSIWNDGGPIPSTPIGKREANPSHTKRIHQIKQCSSIGIWRGYSLDPKR